MFSFFKPVPNISPDDYYAKIEGKNKSTLVDVRTESEYKQGHIKGSILIPLDVLGEKIEEVIPDKSQEIFVNCHSGSRSTQAVHILEDMGYTNVINLQGGILGWERAGYPLNK